MQRLIIFHKVLGVFVPRIVKGTVERVHCRVEFVKIEGGEGETDRWIERQ